MKPLKKYRLSAMVLWLGVCGLAGLVIFQGMRKHRLEEEINRLQRAQSGYWLAARDTKVARNQSPTHGESASVAVLNGVDPMEALKASMDEEMLQGLRGTYGYGPRHPKMKPTHDLIRNLGMDGWEALLGTGHFLKFAFADASAESSGDEKVHAFILTDAFTFLAQADPRKALAIFEKAASGKTGKIGHALHNQVLQAVPRWAESEPLPAIRWAKKTAHLFPNGEEPACSALGTMARTDTAGAWRVLWEEGLALEGALVPLATSMSSREDLDLSMAELTAHSQEAEQPISEKRASKRSLPPGTNFYTYACVDFAEQLALSQSVGEARGFLEKWALRAEDRETAGLALVRSSLVPEDYSEAGPAADWLLEFVPADCQASTVRRLVEDWAEIDFSQAAGWLNRHPAKVWRDEGIAALCRKLAPFDAPAAQAWAEAVSQESLRNSLLVELGVAD